MKFIADLHVHSRFSMATAKTLDLEHLHISAQLKGITAVGTGDITHPGWFSEIDEKLVPAEPGLFKLNDAAARLADEQVPPSCRRPVRFILSSEISNVYKKGGRTRKNHNLVFFPDLETVARFNRRLEAIGNIHSDGRPILGLDAKYLLEIVLETSDRGFLIPAHVWTPWFSLLGSKSGFDSIEECFEDLSDHIFAVETGLSSDPPMNWRVSGLDRLTLVSNSDAHSPQKLGREANWLQTALSFEGIRSAIESGEPDRFLGTFEYYPEQGKYHLDGHRKCEVCLHPSETDAHQGNCPVCGKPLTLGVLYRVGRLADRERGRRPESALPFVNGVPLSDILSEVCQAGENTNKVRKAHAMILDRLGSEFDILYVRSPEEIAAAGGLLLSEAIERMRSGRITLKPGYDGEFGRVRIFEPEERRRLTGQQCLFIMPAEAPGVPDERTDFPAPPPKPKNECQRPPPVSDPPKTGLLGALNEAQRRAVLHGSGPLLISAGPGTGKTRTLTHRIAYLIREMAVPPDRILAVTFTAKATDEMRERLHALLGIDSLLPWVTTFHSLCLNLLLERADRTADGVIDDADRDALLGQAIEMVKKKASRRFSMPLSKAHDAIVSAKQSLESPAQFKKRDTSDDQALTRIYEAYQAVLAAARRYDYEDLIFQAVSHLETDAAYRRHLTERFSHLFVDEYQDLNLGQYRLVKALSSPVGNLCVIGDPDQSIYGFRGSDAAYFSRFLEDFPHAEEIYLIQNYRSTQVILDAASQVIGFPKARILSNRKGAEKPILLEAGSEREEARIISDIIENLVGGSGYHRLDAGRVADANVSAPLGFSDFAVLYRTGAQQEVFAKALAQQGIPFQVASRERIQGDKDLRAFMSLVRVVSGFGTYADFLRIHDRLRPGIAGSVAAGFFSWAVDQGLDFQSALSTGARSALSGLSPSSRTKLADFLRALVEMAEAVSGFSPVETIEYVTSHPMVDPNLKASQDVRERLDGLLKSVAGREKDLSLFFSGLALQTDTDFYVSMAEKVSLMTLHAAKGLEFPVVFMVGCEEDLLPLRRGRDDEVDSDEERRLFYVGMTRAEERLYFSWSKNRLIHGKRRVRRISPFMADIAEDLLQREPSPGEGLKKRPTQLSLF
jgi:ATP-dependent DNA helicase UvrD/PcrA